MTQKRRLSATIDADLLAAAERATKRGDAPTISAWVNDALRLKADHDRRLAAVDEFLAEYEAEHGEITEDEKKIGEKKVQDLTDKSIATVDQVAETKEKEIMEL